MYINSINYFRGIAILFIVAGHCLIFFGNKSITNTDSIIIKSILNLILGGSTLFVFISGFLFHHVYYKKFNFKKFYIKKLKFVFLPFLFLTTIATIILIFKCLFNYHNEFEEAINCITDIPFFKFYLTGEHFFIGYWYIPFIMIVFGLSPIFISFVKLNNKLQIFIVFILFICSIFIHRGEHILQNTFFYISVYLFGILCSIHKNFIYRRLEGKELYFLIGAISLAITQSYVHNIGTYEKPPFVYGGVDLMVIQKIFLSVFFLIWLRRFENHNFKLLNLIALNSFGIYFIHGIVTWTTEIVKLKMGILINLNQYLVYGLYFIFIIICSLTITVIVKRITPKYSRLIIGS